MFRQPLLAFSEPFTQPLYHIHDNLFAVATPSDERNRLEEGISTEYTLMLNKNDDVKRNMSKNIYEISF